MEQILMGMFLVYVIVILYVHYRYNHDPKSQNQYEFYREELEIEPTLAAYLINEDYEWTNFILADVLTLVKEGYVILEKQGEDYIFIRNLEQKEMPIKSHQMMAYNTLFTVLGESVQRVSLQEFKERMKEEKVVESLQIKEHAIKQAMRLELEKQGIIDIVSRKKLFKYNRLAITIMLISIVSCIVSLLATQMLYMIVSAFFIITSVLFYMVTNYSEEKLTQYGAECREKAIGLKNYIEEYVISEDRPIDAVIVLDYYYIMAVAIGEADLAEKQFIKKDYERQKRRKRMKFKDKKLIINITLIVIMILYYYIIFKMN